MAILNVHILHYSDSFITHRDVLWSLSERWDYNFKESMLWHLFASMSFWGEILGHNFSTVNNWNSCLRVLYVRSHGKLSVDGGFSKTTACIESSVWTYVKQNCAGKILHHWFCMCKFLSCLQSKTLPSVCFI